MATDVSTFRARFPEFADVLEYPDARIQIFIDDTILYIGDDELRWGSKYDTAQAYLAAHLLASGSATEAGDTSAQAGPIQQATAGGVSVTKAVLAKDRSDGDEFFASTSYGQRYLVIRNMCFVGAVVACDAS